MSELLHRIRVFVYNLSARKPEYLLLKAPQGIESFWGPIQGNIGFGEKLDTAIRREVLDETGILRPVDLIDLEMPARWVLGDEEIIEWNFGFRSGVNRLPEVRETNVEFQWLDFSHAYPSLELEIDRAAILRLHTLLSAA